MYPGNLLAKRVILNLPPSVMLMVFTALGKQTYHMNITFSHFIYCGMADHIS